MAATGLTTSQPWSQLTLDMTAVQGTSAYIRFRVSGSGRAYVNYLKQSAAAPRDPTPLLDPDDPPPPVWGPADLHTHPFATHMSNGHIVAGGYPSGWQDPVDLPASCADQHPNNPLISQIPDGHLTPGVTGAPGFADWPPFTGGIHQQMHPAWIKRAWEGGLRLMTALVVNHQLLEVAWKICHDQLPGDEAAAGVVGAAAVPEVLLGEFLIPIISAIVTGNVIVANALSTPSDYDDMAAITDQVAQFDAMIAANTSWMEKALTPADARRIIGQAKLAIVYGLEVDTFLGKWKAGEGLPDDATLAAQADFLYDQCGIRQINPVHVANNAFGGCSVYQELFNLNNWWVNRDFYAVAPADANPADPSSAIDFRLEPEIPLPGFLSSLLGLPSEPDYDHGDGAVPAGHGERNVAGAANDIDRALNPLMARGMLIDVDHMSASTTESVLQYCSGASVQIPIWQGEPRGGSHRVGERTAQSNRPPYPVISAHTSFRGVCRRRNWGDESHPGPGQRASAEYWPHESAKSDSVAQRVIGSGGMLAPITCMIDTVQDRLLRTDPPVAPNASGTSKSYAQQLRHATALADGGGVGIGTDRDLLTQCAPRFGPLACWG